MTEIMDAPTWKDQREQRRQEKADQEYQHEIRQMACTLLAGMASNSNARSSIGDPLMQNVAINIAEAVYSASLALSLSHKE